MEEEAQLPGNALQFAQRLVWIELELGRVVFALRAIEIADALQHAYVAARTEALRRTNEPDTYYPSAPAGYWDGWKNAIEWVYTSGNQNYKRYLPDGGTDLGKLTAKRSAA